MERDERTRERESEHLISANTFLVLHFNPEDVRNKYFKFMKN